MTGAPGGKPGRGRMQNRGSGAAAHRRPQAIGRRRAMKLSKGKLSMPKLFDSREDCHRSPFGAVAEGTPVFFRICLPRPLKSTAAQLLVQEDGGEESRLEMFWAGMEGQDQEWWDCHYAPPRPGLYWYGFRLETPDGVWYLSRCGDGSAALTREIPARWQLTCYAADFRTPDWLAGGVM